MSDPTSPSPAGDQASPPASGAVPPPAYGATPPPAYRSAPPPPSGATAPPPYGSAPVIQPYGSAPAIQPYTPPAAPQQGYAAPPSGYPVYGAAPAFPAPRPASGLAITSLICGIVGVVFGTFLFFIVLPFLASVVAVITGHLALRKTKTDPSVGGRGMAFAGLIMGYVMVAVSVILLGVVLFGFLFFGAFTLPFVLSS